jgi:starch synthase
VVARTGGLADTVIDANLAARAARVATGIQFAGVSYQGLAAAISRAIALYGQCDEWQALQRGGMKADFSWHTSGAAYAALYRELTGKA